MESFGLQIDSQYNLDSDFPQSTPVSWQEDLPCNQFGRSGHESNESRFKEPVAKWATSLSEQIKEIRSTLKG